MPVEPAGESGGTLRAFWLGEPASLEGDTELAWPSPPSPLFKILTPPKRDTIPQNLYSVQGTQSQSWSWPASEEQRQRTEDRIERWNRKCSLTASRNPLTLTPHIAPQK